MGRDISGTGVYMYWPILGNSFVKMPPLKVHSGGNFGNILPKTDFLSLFHMVHFHKTPLLQLTSSWEGHFKYWYIDVLVHFKSWFCENAPSWKFLLGVSFVKQPTKIDLWGHFRSCYMGALVHFRRQFSLPEGISSWSMCF